MQTNVEFYVNWDNGITDIVPTLLDCKRLARIAPMGHKVLFITKYWTDSKGVNRSKIFNF
jgi:hypothetical protein